MTDQGAASFAPRFGWRRALSVAFYGVLMALLAYYLRDVNWRQLSGLKLTPAYLLFAFPLSLLPRFLQPVPWALLIRDYGDRPPPYPQMTAVFAKSWLGRYIPGKLAWIGAKVLFGREYGVRAGVLGATGLAEAGLQIATALGVSFLLLGIANQSKPLGEGVRLFAVLAFIGTSVVLFPPVFNAIIARAYALSRQAVSETGRLSLRALLGAAALYAVVHLIGGPPVFLLLKMIYAPLALVDLPYLTAAFLLAGALGTLAIFAPAGMGVREGILLVLLGVLMPKEIAAIAVVFLRVWTIVVDLVFYALALMLDRAFPMNAARA